MATKMKYEDVKVDEEGAGVGRIRTLTSPDVPKLPPMCLRGASEGGEARANVAPAHTSATHALFIAAGPALEAPIKSNDPMMVEMILTSGGDTSVGGVQTYLVGIRSKTAHKESEMNETESGAAQLQQEEMKEQVGNWKKEVPSQAREDPMSVTAWKLLYPRTARLVFQRGGKSGRLCSENEHV